LSKTATDRILFLRAALAAHENYWEALRPTMGLYRRAYLTRFWEGRKDVLDESCIRVETSDGYATIESLMGSLFTKYPGVEVAPDPTGAGSVEVTKTLSNEFLTTVRAQVENAGRMALIYPQSFLKLAPRESNSILGKVALRALPPWQVLLDRDASAYEDARYVGHVYYLPVSDANEKFGRKKWVCEEQKDFFAPTDKKAQGYTKDTTELPEEYLYVRIIEMYDFQHDELLFWSPNWDSGKQLLSRDMIPVRTFDDRPLSNLVPFYFSRQPDKPMDGYSTMSRVYDQIHEKNVLRTFWANAVRRDSRQFLYRKDSLDPDQLAKVTAGQDGAMIEVDGDGSLDGMIALVPTGTLNTDHSAYLAYIEQDLQRGSMTAGFVRGEASKATATEVSVLAQYTASELGKMARDRDQTIEQAVLVYIRMLIPLVDDKQKLVINTAAGAKVVTAEALDADWTIYALDGGSTPTTDVMRKQQLIQLVPTLMQLGVKTNDLKAELVRLYDLPEDFLKAVDAPPSEGGLPPLPTLPTPPSTGEVS